MAERRSASLSEEQIRQARGRNLIEYLESLGHHPASRSKGTRAMFHSPLRVDKNPSFSVSEKDGAWVWYDFGTKEHGDVISFAMRYHGWSFVEAVEHLAGAAPAPPRRPSASPRASGSAVATRIAEAQKRYRDAKLVQTPEDQAAIAAYFAERYRLPVYPELNAVVLRYGVPLDSEREGEPTRWQEVRYLAVPVPNLQRFRGLECRALEPERVPEAWRRISLGQKTIWVLRRHSPWLLVTESIVDALAGDQLYPDWRFTLVGLNGIGNWERLDGLVKQLQPKAVWLALDNDPDAPGLPGDQKGPATERRIADLLVPQGVDVRYVRQHYAHGVKDLGALWRMLAPAVPRCA